MLHFIDLPNEERARIVDDHDYFVFDIDGVIFNGPVLVPHAEDVMKKLHASGKIIKLFTNNCAASRKEIHRVLSRSFPFLKKEDIISSSLLAAKYFKETLGNKKLFVPGGKGILEELDGMNIDYITSQNKKITGMTDLVEMKLNKDVGAVLLAYDIDFNFTKLFELVNYVQDPQISYVQTHIDKFVRLKCDMALLPGVGATAAAVEAVTGRIPTNIGKPSEFARAYLLSQIPLGGKAVFVGDT
ncbi:pyridoxal phosphate phosphatase-like isoform X2 [Cimex lectularius]|nr:pyridoxal phosphate phosphatase-like isoform X2 [Cimex lectularius]